MSDQKYNPDPASSRPMQALLRAIRSDFASGLPALPFVERLMTEAARNALADDIIAFASANRPDAARWLRWATGGPAPFASDDGGPCEPSEAGHLRHPRMREKQSVGRMATEARSRVDDLSRQIDETKSRLAELEAKRDHYDEVSRAAVVYGVVDAIRKQLIVPETLGCAYTILRVVSGRIIDPNVVVPAGMTDSPDTRRGLSMVDAGKVRDVLGALVGDREFETDLYVAIRGVAFQHKPRADELAAKQTAARLERARAEAHEILAACRATMTPEERLLVDAELEVWVAFPTPIELVDEDGQPTFDEAFLDRISQRAAAARTLLAHGVGTLTGAAIGASVDVENELRANATMLVDLGRSAASIKGNVRPFWLEELASRRDGCADPVLDDLPPIAGNELDRPSIGTRVNEDVPFIVP